MSGIRPLRRRLATVMRLSRTRATLLAAAMNIGTAEPLDIFRYLRVPAIHLVLRRVAERRAGRTCSEPHRRPRPAARISPRGWLHRDRQERW